MFALPAIRGSYLFESWIVNEVLAVVTEYETIVRLDRECMIFHMPAPPAGHVWTL